MRRILTLAFVLVLASCSRGYTYQIEGSSQVVTLTNLHAQGNVITSVNYQYPDMIPLCTPVNIESVDSRQAIFTVIATGQRYTYQFTRHLREPVDVHISKYFGGSCPDYSSLPQQDQAGIQAGQVMQGMSKQGVLLAIGYPPDHRTPTLDQDVWTYWGGNRRAFQVQFQNGYVAGIR